MKKITVIFILCILFSTKNFSQKQFVKDTLQQRHLKTFCYLEIFLDQMSVGLVKQLDEMNIRNSFLDSIVITSVGVENLPSSLFVYKILMPNENNLEYVLCYNRETQQFYNIKGFYHNEYSLFFDFLKSKKYKISHNFFRRKSIKIPEVDLNCLIDLYNSKKQFDLRNIDTKQYPCLQYNLEPINTF